MIKIGQIKSENNKFHDNDLVCYCFEFTKIDIEQDIENHGFSMILEKIKTEKKNNGCNCEAKNPKGR